MSWRGSGIDWVYFYHFVSREQKFRSEIGKGESNILVGNRAREEGRNIFLLWGRSSFSEYKQTARGAS